MTTRVSGLEVEPTIKGKLLDLFPFLERYGLSHKHKRIDVTLDLTALRPEPLSPEERGELVDNPDEIYSYVFNEKTAKATVIVRLGEWPGQQAVVLDGGPSGFVSLSSESGVTMDGVPGDQCVEVFLGRPARLAMRQGKGLGEVKVEAS